MSRVIRCAYAQDNPEIWCAEVGTQWTGGVLYCPRHAKRIEDFIRRNEK